VVSPYVKLLVNLYYNVHTRGVVKGVEAVAHQAMFCYNLRSVGNCFQENVKVLFGLNNEILQVKKDWKAHGIHIPLLTVQVNYHKLNLCILLNCDEDSRGIEKMDFVCSCFTISNRSIFTISKSSTNLQLLELCALHIDSSDMKLLECLLVSDSENRVEPNVAMELPLQFTSSKLANGELISSRLKGTLLTDKQRSYLVVRCNKVVIQGNEASVADESLTFIIFETLCLVCGFLQSISLLELSIWKNDESLKERY
nr:hypothetical protein [Tanacetum cinerariifolium]